MPLSLKIGIDEAVKVSYIKFLTLNTLFNILCDDIVLLLHSKVWCLYSRKTTWTKCARFS